MKTIFLTPNNNTTCLGFGTATLARMESHRAIAKIIGVALDAGITHFDTARLYGYGSMERLLGSVLRERRDQVTIATKFGLEPPIRHARFAALLQRAKGLVKKVGFLRTRARAFATKLSAGRYDVANARASLETSLKELGTDYVDLFLVHEGSVANATDEALIAFLAGEKAKGRIRAFGLAANFETTSAMPDAALGRYDVIQIPSDVLNANMEKVSARVRGSIVTHSVFGPLPMIAERLTRSESLRREWETQLGVDLHDRSTLPRLLLQSALTGNPQGVTLFSAVNEAHIRANVSATANLPSEAQRSLLRKLVSELAS
jgi:D-threo-aldose 1-dehydrogenase